MNRSRATRGESPRALDRPRLPARFPQAGGQARQPSVQCLVRRGRIESAAPFSPTRLCDSSCRHWSSPGESSASLKPPVAVVPNPPRLLATRTANRSSLSLRHDSVPVATSSRPVRVPESAGAGDEPAVCRWYKNVRECLQIESCVRFGSESGVRDPDAREGGGRSRAPAEAGEDRGAVLSRWPCCAVPCASNRGGRGCCRGRIFRLSRIE